MKKILMTVFALMILSNTLYGEQQFYIYEKKSSKFIRISILKKGGGYLYLEFCENQEDSHCITHLQSLTDLDSIIDAQENEYISQYQEKEDNIKNIGKYLKFLLQGYYSSDDNEKLITGTSSSILAALTTILATYTQSTLLKDQKSAFLYGILPLSAVIVGIYSYWHWSLSDIEESKNLLLSLEDAIDAYRAGNEFFIILEDVDTVWDVVTETF